MPAPRWVARANKVGLNRLTKFIAPWAPGWAVVIHQGRKSGRAFRTPLWAFRRRGGYVIALTYGSGADWVRNVLAAGGCELESRRRHYQLGAPRLYRDENASDMPAFIRFMLRRVIKAPEFLSLDIISERPTKTSSRSGAASSEVPAMSTHRTIETWVERFNAGDVAGIVDGDWAALEWIDPDGFRGCGFFHVRGGLIVQQRGYWDSAQLNEIHPDVHPD